MSRSFLKVVSGYWPNASPRSFEALSRHRVCPPISPISCRPPPQLRSGLYVINVVDSHLGIKVMIMLSKRIFQSIARDYRREYALDLRLLELNGRVTRPETTLPIERLGILDRTRAHNLREALRWGDPQAFFLAPGIMSWIVPLVDNETLKGGLTGGYVRFEQDTESQTASANYLATHGAPLKDAMAFIEKTPLFEKERLRDAADFLQTLFYQYSGWEPVALERNRERMIMQRQVAEEIHRRKRTAQKDYSYDDERILLSYIQVGDQTGARSIFNRMLAAMFLYSPKTVVVQARAIEMMGYLTRAAVENNPLMAPLLERHMVWIERLVEARRFDELCYVMRDALDDFMESIMQHNTQPTNPSAVKALRFMKAHFSEPISLDDIAQAAGLSKFRIAHILKEATGRTPLQNIQHMRIQEARRLLEESDISCTDIAQTVGMGDQSYFIKVFRKWIGTTPAKYRRTHR